MLTLTDSASSAVKDLSDRTLGTDTGGLRIATANDGSTNFAVTVTPEPEPTDQVVEASGARVFLDETASAAVSDKVLDARIDDEGGVRFALNSAV